MLSILNAMLPKGANVYDNEHNFKSYLIPDVIYETFFGLNQQAFDTKIKLSSLIITKIMNYLGGQLIRNMRLHKAIYQQWSCVKV